jgi:ectoine hydroxylase-related dioxygenase (phytanoyl-CoA dioxygenase family)
MFFAGLIQHCAMPNRAKSGSRTGLIVQFLPKYVRPMEDLKASIRQETIDSFPEVI